MGWFSIPQGTCYPRIGSPSRFTVTVRVCVERRITGFTWTETKFCDPRTLNRDGTNFSTTPRHPLNSRKTACQEFRYNFVLNRRTRRYESNAGQDSSFIETMNAFKIACEQNIPQKGVTYTIGNENPCTYYVDSGLVNCEDPPEPIMDPVPSFTQTTTYKDIQECTLTQKPTTFSSTNGNCTSTP
jgi:hypothetical protein